ncbi:hypothetical protein, partial [Pseudomonas aeruginosa]
MSFLNLPVRTLVAACGLSLLLSLIHISDPTRHS